MLWVLTPAAKVGGFENTTGGVPQLREPSEVNSRKQPQDTSKEEPLLSGVIVQV